MSAFRDLAGKFADDNAQVLGISTDTLDTQKKFADSLKLPFPLLADADGSMAKAYGVFEDGHAQRVTFVVGPDGKIEKVLQGKEALDPAPALLACPLHRK
jgi:thioredoxin-dependent peroxiredoxin